MGRTSSRTGPCISSPCARLGAAGESCKPLAPWSSGELSGIRPCAECLCQTEINAARCRRCICTICGEIAADSRSFNAC